LCRQDGHLHHGFIPILLQQRQGHKFSRALNDPTIMVEANTAIRQLIELAP